MRLHGLFAARTFDFAVLTERGVFLISTGFFTRRARRCVYAARLDEIWVSRAPKGRGVRLRLASAQGSAALDRTALGRAQRRVRRRARRAYAHAARVSCVIAIDAGTTGVRSFVVGDDGDPQTHAYREFPQHFPRPGWVEHDADDILRVTIETLDEVAREIRDRGERVAAIGITNQRETVVVWDRRSGRPRSRAIVWQDRRTAQRCDELRAAGHEPMIRRATGLVLDPYFSASKLSWLLHEGGVTADDDLVFGTVDSWLLWNLTGGINGGVHATDPSNASRTMLYDIGAGAWSDELCGLFDVPRACLPEVLPSSGRFGTTDPARAAGLRVPVSGIAGDQQSALFGQACVVPGHDEEHVRHRLVRAHQRRLRAAGAGRRSADDHRLVARAR